MSNLPFAPAPAWFLKVTGTHVHHHPPYHDVVSLLFTMEKLVLGTQRVLVHVHSLFPGATLHPSVRQQVDGDKCLLALENSCAGWIGARKTGFCVDFVLPFVFPFLCSFFFLTDNFLS